EGGISSYVEFMNRSKDVLHEPIYATGEDDDIEVEVALQYNDGYASNLYSFANNIHTHEGGTHEAGFRTALTRVTNDYVRRSHLSNEDDEELTGDDAREGMTAIVSVEHTDPRFVGQTKTKVVNGDVRTITDSVFSEVFSKYLFHIPTIGKLIVVKGMMA